MANFYAKYPSTSSSGGGGGGNASVGPNGSPIPTDSTLVGFEDPSGNLEPGHLDSNGYVEVIDIPLNAKTASSLVTVPFDYIELAYVGATTDIDTVIYKSGGAAGTTVATLTLGYDGSDRLTSVTKS